MVAIEEDGEIIPKIKISENIEKITTPGFKTLFRLYDKDSGKAIADVITLDHENIPPMKNTRSLIPNSSGRGKLSPILRQNLRVADLR